MSLKRELEIPAAPLRQLFDAALPDHREVQRAVRERLRSIEPVLPPASPDGGRIPYDVLGHAISVRISWQLAPDMTVVSAGFGDPKLRMDLLGELHRLPDPTDPDRSARVAWFVGLLDRSFRSGRFDEPWYEPFFSSGTLDELLASAPSSWVADVQAVAERCQPCLAGLGREDVHVGPTFVGSAAIGGADADFICDGQLIDTKATKEPGLRLRDLQQVIGYAALDWDNRYEIHSVGFLYARYGELITWPLDELLSELSAGRESLPTVREKVQQLIA